MSIWKHLLTRRCPALGFIRGLENGTNPCSHPGYLGIGMQGEHGRGAEGLPALEVGTDPGSPPGREGRIHEGLGSTGGLDPRDFEARLHRISPMLNMLSELFPKLYRPCPWLWPCSAPRARGAAAVLPDYLHGKHSKIPPLWWLEMGIFWHQCRVSSSGCSSLPAL